MATRGSDASASDPLLPIIDTTSGAAGNVVAVNVLPSWVVDRLPIRWWKPGNLRITPFGDLHFCDDNHVRTIEWNGKTVAEGKALFPYDHRWE